MKTEWTVKIGHSEVVVAVAEEEVAQFDTAFSGLVSFWGEQKEVEKRFSKFCQRRSKGALTMADFISVFCA